MSRPVEEMDALEFRRYAKSLPEAEREQVRRERNAWRFKRWYATSERHRPRVVMTPEQRLEAKRAARRRWRAKQREAAKT